MQINHDFVDWLLQSTDLKVDELRYELVKRFNADTSQSLNSESLTLSEEVSILQWIHQNEVYFTKTEQVYDTPSWFLNETDKNSFIANALCLRAFTNPFPEKNTPLRLPPLSRQSKAERRKKLREYIKNHVFIKETNLFTPEDRLYLKLVFTIRESRDKDVDNMAKEVIDALKGELFPDDKQIHHLEIIKFKTTYLEENIKIQIRISSINDHSNIIFRDEHINWAGQQKVNL